MSHHAPSIAAPAAGRKVSRRRACALLLGLALVATPFDAATAAGLPPPKPAPGTQAARNERGRDADDQRFVWPARGVITTHFGEVGPYSPRGHAGLDIAGPTGTPIYAAASGRVVQAGMTGGGYGIQVLIEHDDGVTTRYAHLSRLSVGAGEHVRAGEQIGLMGSTGYSTGSHLHFEVIQGDALRDPLAFLP